MNKNNKTMNKKQPKFVNRSTADEPKKKQQPKFVNRSTVDEQKTTQVCK